MGLKYHPDRGSEELNRCLLPPDLLHLHLMCKRGFGLEGILDHLSSTPAFQDGGFVRLKLKNSLQVSIHGRPRGLLPKFVTETGVFERALAELIRLRLCCL